MIGTIEVFDVENDGYGMVGCCIAPWLWGMGCCTEALRRVVEFIFTQTPMDRQEDRADVRNTGSNRVLEKCGFTLEGTIRHGKMVSQYCDHHIWGPAPGGYGGQVSPPGPGFVAFPAIPSGRAR